MFDAFRITRLLAATVFLFALGCGDCGDDQNTNNGTDVAVDDVSVDLDMGNDDRDTDLSEPDLPDRPRPDVSFDFGPFPDLGPVVLAVDSVVPPSGPITGGTSVVINGSGFSEDTVVLFGSREVDVTLVGGNLVGLSPEGAGIGPVNVKVISPDLGTEVLEDGFTYTEEIVIDSIVPARVPTTGGVEVTISGRGFDQDTRVSFGGATGVRHTVADGTIIRVVTPPGPAGDVVVRASSPIGSATAPDLLTYFEPLRIDEIDPATGPPIGGNTVNISGGGFELGMSFEFGGVASPSVAVNPNGQSAIVEVPANAAGLVDVRAATEGGDAIVKPDAYFYAAPGTFAIVAATPIAGPVSGGTDVTLIGAGLNALNFTATFGGQTATIVSQSAGHAVVTTPPGAAVGTVDIVIDNGSTTSTLPNAFTYVDDLQISDVAPNSGSSAGGEDVVLTGIGFTGVQRVLFGGLAAGFTVDSDTQITASTPSHSAGLVDVSVDRGDLTVVAEDAFTFEESLEVYGFFPVKGAIAGNTYVEIRGRGFTPATTATFNQVAVQDVQFLDAQTIAVRTPPQPEGLADVVVTRGADATPAPFPFTYFDPGARFGGAWGDPVQGAVNVTVFSTGGTAIEDAFVMLSTNAQTPYQGQTDANGMVVLSGPDVYGEQTITAVAAGYSSTSIQRVDAENITIFLSPPPQQGPPPPGTPPAIFTGFISGLDKLAEPGPDEFQMAIVSTTQSDPFSQNPPTGDGNVVLTNGTYTLTSRLGDLAVVAVGGLYNNATQEFKPLRMGIARYQFAASGETYVVDLDLDIPMNTVLTFKLNNTPTSDPLAPMENVVTPWLNLGFEGVFGGIDVAEGSGDIVQATAQVALAGVLSDANYFAIGGSYAPGGLPQTVALNRNITNTSNIIQMNLVGFAGVTSPSNGTFPINGLFEFDLNAQAEPDFFYVIIQTPLGVPVWNVFLPGSERSFRLPDFPDFSFLPPEERPVPYPGGQYLVDIIGFERPGFNYANVTYNDISFGDLTAYSYTRTVVQF